MVRMEYRNLHDRRVDFTFKAPRRLHCPPRVPVTYPTVLLEAPGVSVFFVLMLRTWAPLLFPRPSAASGTLQLPRAPHHWGRSRVPLESCCHYSSSGAGAPSAVHTQQRPQCSPHLQRWAVGRLSLSSFLLRCAHCAAGCHSRSFGSAGPRRRHGPARVRARPSSGPHRCLASSEAGSPLEQGPPAARAQQQPRPAPRHRRRGTGRAGLFKFEAPSTAICRSRVCPVLGFYLGFRAPLFQVGAPFGRVFIVGTPWGQDYC
ncbi:hypothetical protein NDU88_003470 [Pleurodeles waltl]|uniref:Uncharacterized protein n=1 Tax=Pleurodeles waltl TaxID=8319 RepID=A0AAV7UE50_PLEWA|nr:hypothetical protein NDU88_003470 [Pleurodeles waltl]